MFIPTINTGGRDDPFSIPIGLEAKSLKNRMTYYWISRAHENKQTKHTKNAKYISKMIKIKSFGVKNVNQSYKTEWERDREKVEFERAAMLFKPMNFSMSSKFVSAGSSEEADKKNEAKEKILTESEKAVQMKMFGNLTRYVIVCKAE